MQAYTAAQIRAAEQPLLEAGVPLMQRAAAALAAVIRRHCAENHRCRILALVGAGNNGGDALFAVAELARHGAQVDIVRTAERVHEEGLHAAVRAGAQVLPLPDAHQLAIDGYDCVIDGILGTGSGMGSATSPALRGRAREIVQVMLTQLATRREAGAPVIIAVDLPSGVHPDTGQVPDPAVLPADVTVTFGAAKIGLLREPARQLVGDLDVVDIGLGPQLAQFDGLRS